MKTPSTRGGAANQQQQGSRGGSACIGLLVVAICLQLYVISLWLTPQGKIDPTNLSTCTTQKSQQPYDGKVVRILTAEQAAETTLPDSDAAITALHLLSKFIKQNAGRLDSKRHPQQASNVKVTVSPALPGHEGHDHAKGEGSDDIIVGAGDVPKGNIHGHSHAHADSAHEHHPGDTHDESFLKSKPNLYHDIWLNISSQWADDILSPERYQRLDPEQKKRQDQCDEYQKIGHVIPDESWGDLPESLRSPFDQLICSDLISLKAAAEYVKKHPDLYNRVWAVPEDRQRVQAEPGMEDKVIATIVAMTTRTLTVNKLDDLALFRDLFPSFTRTVEPGFEYWFYLGYDKGDPWLDNAEHLSVVRSWFDEHVSKTLKNRGIVCKLIYSTWQNDFHRPGPAFNHVTGVAYADGATWIYRINDDQLFESPWAKAFVDTLLEMGPPYGVVGPACGQGATHILVVDFVHRTHHEIFPTHYPPALQAWWMDNWVSQVYGRKRTKRVNSAKITHLTETHKTRYPVTGFAQYCRGEIVRGRAMFEEYLSHTPGMQEQLKSYRADSFSYATR